MTVCFSPGMRLRLSGKASPGSCPVADRDAEQMLVSKGRESGTLVPRARQELLQVKHYI